MKKKYGKYNFFLAPEGESFGGEGGGGEANLGGDGVAPTPAPAPSPTLDASAFAKEFGNVISEQFKAREQSTPKTWTPEEIADAKKSLKYWEPSADFGTRLLNIETQPQALQELRDGIFNQSITVAQALMQQQQQQFESRLTPLQGIIQQQEAQARQERFNTTFPALANPDLAPVLNAAITQLSSSGQLTGKSEKEAFKAVADFVSKAIKVHNPTFTLETATANAGGNNTRTSNAIPVTSGGSGGVGGQGGDGGGKAKNFALAHLGKTPK